MKKAGIIRCRQTEDMCPGTMDFKVAAQGTLGFREMGPVELIGFVSCGGCPGKMAVPRAEMLINRGAEIVVFASCMTKGNPIGFPCPHFRLIIESVKQRIGDKAAIVEWTH